MIRGGPFGSCGGYVFCEIKDCPANNGKKHKKLLIIMILVYYIQHMEQSNCRIGLQFPVVFINYKNDSKTYSTIYLTHKSIQQFKPSNQKKKP